ncbi:S41 family peptidase [Pseudoxanthomonas suwonensis]|uniref:S41 family peptidase n=1 Tax=Pseudoxanthomonas suwonensis TaxID=314722 RepID=UPI0006962C1B|nr:S41 family peptidase [Pseudoxanthomonas suwonensis]
MFRAILLLAVCLSWLPSCLVAAEPRAVAGEVAATIEREYFDPQRGAGIAAALRADADRGDFDRLQDPLDLATALTTRLKPHDRHFNVRWSAGDEAPANGPRRPPPGAGPARDNFGIRRVEVLPGNVGYLDLRQFADFDFADPQAPARQAIDAALQLLAHVDALIIDLRDNGGGSPAMVGYLASAFAEPGADIYNTFHSRTGTRSEAPAQGFASPRTQLPLYVLTSGRTGSAAEAFAYTLKNARRATVVGEASGGAANPGRPFRLGDGFSVFVSTGSPVSPVTGSNWEGTGVAPDVEVAAADALDRARRLALAALVERGAGEPARWALEAADATPATDATTLAGFAGDYGVLRVELAEGALQLRQDRRPALRLRPLSADMFFVDGEPTRRVRFERRPDGSIAALELQWADGQRARHARGEG